MAMRRFSQMQKVRRQVFEWRRTKDAGSARCDVVSANSYVNGEGGGRFLQRNGKKIRERFKRDVEARGDVFLLVLAKIGPLQCFGIDGCLTGKRNV